MSNLGLKRTVSDSVYKNLRDEIPDLQSQINLNGANISKLMGDIDDLKINLPKFYKTLIFRQQYTQASRFDTFNEAVDFNSTINNPETSLKYSIINQTEDIKGDYNTYCYMIKVISYTSVNKEHGEHTVDLSENGKDILVISQGYSPFWSNYDKDGVDCTVIHSSGMFRSSLLTGGLKHTTTTPSRFAFCSMIGATTTLQRYYGIGYFQTLSDYEDLANGGEYDYYKIQSYRSNGHAESGVEYKNAIVEVYQISTNDYERPEKIGSDTISTEMQGTCITNLKYI